MTLTNYVMYMYVYYYLSIYVYIIYITIMLLFLYYSTYIRVQKRGYSISTNDIHTQIDTYTKGGNMEKC